MIPDNIISDSTYEVEVCGTRFISNEVSKEFSTWFSDIIGTPCRLVKMPSDDTRVKKFNKPPFESTLSFADGYPILILGSQSLNHLNEKLRAPIPDDRFRANIIFETKEPHEEDEWANFNIGDEVSIRNIKPCVRCQVITINQDTAIKGMEPNKTLATYRRFDQGICFGSNAIVMKEGHIKVGDEVK